MKTLLLGSNGQLGEQLRKDLPELLPTISFTKQSLDISNYELLNAIIDEHSPDIIINAAAYTSVDKAENNKNKAFTINSTAIDYLSEISFKKDIWLVHFSTDYVFDGKKKNRYRENDKTNPLSIYGESKLAGENKIINSKCKHIIFRTSWVCGEYGGNFIKTIINLSKTKNSISVVTDQVGVPTSTTLISRITKKLICDIKNFNSWNSGIYNLVPNGETNWYEIAMLISDIAIQDFNDENFKNLSIKKILSSEYLTSAKRPLNSLLCNEKIQKQLKFTLPYWQEDFIPLVRTIFKSN